MVGIRPKIGWFEDHCRSSGTGVPINICLLGFVLLSNVDSRVSSNNVHVALTSRKPILVKTSTMDLEMKGNLPFVKGVYKCGTNVRIQPLII